MKTIIREKITPRGDGNLKLLISYKTHPLLYTRKDNSERRRKQNTVSFILTVFLIIREKITPRGDGNCPKSVIL